MFITDNVRRSNSLLVGGFNTPEKYYSSIIVLYWGGHKAAGWPCDPFFPRLSRSLRHKGHVTLCDSDVKLCAPGPKYPSRTVDVLNCSHAPDEISQSNSWRRVRVNADKHLVPPCCLVSISFCFRYQDAESTGMQSLRSTWDGLSTWCITLASIIG